MGIADRSSRAVGQAGQVAVTGNRLPSMLY